MSSHYKFRFEKGQTLKFWDFPIFRVTDEHLGGFGEVYVLDSLDKERPGKMCIKSFRTDNEYNFDQMDAFKNEDEFWHSLPLHPNILPCLGVVEKNSIPFAFFPYIQGPKDAGPSLRHVLRVYRINNEGIYTLRYCNKL